MVPGRFLGGPWGLSVSPWGSFLRFISEIRFSRGSRAEAENFPIGLFSADDGKLAAGRRFSGVALIQKKKVRETGFTDTMRILNVFMAPL